MAEGTVQVRLYGPARESLGMDRLKLALPPGDRSLARLIADLGHEHPKLVPILGVSRFAVNGEYGAPRSRRLRSGDEVAVHPPYSGG
jgi:molybdopterin converting factor small subunit